MISAATVRRKTLRIPYNKYLCKLWLNRIDEEIREHIKNHFEPCIKYKLYYGQRYTTRGGWGIHYHEYSPNTYLMLLQKLRNKGYKASIQREIWQKERPPHNFENDYVYVSW